MLNASLVREGGRAYCRIGVLPSQVLLILSIIHYFRYPQTVLGPTCAKWIRLINHKEIPPTGSPGWGLERPNTHSFLGAHPYCTTKCLYSVIDFEPAWIYYTDGEQLAIIEGVIPRSKATTRSPGVVATVGDGKGKRTWGLSRPSAS